MGPRGFILGESKGLPGSPGETSAQYRMWAFLGHDARMACRGWLQGPCSLTSLSSHLRKCHLRLCLPCSRAPVQRQPTRKQVLCLPGGTRLSALAKVHPQFLSPPFKPALTLHPFFSPEPLHPLFQKQKGEISLLASRGHCCHRVRTPKGGD